MPPWLKPIIDWVVGLLGPTKAKTEEQLGKTEQQAADAQQGVKDAEDAAKIRQQVDDAGADAAFDDLDSELRKPKPAVDDNSGGK